MEFHQKQSAIRSAIERLHSARMAHKTALKIHQDAKIWRIGATEDERLWELETRVLLDRAGNEVKAVEAELRRIKLAKLH